MTIRQNYIDQFLVYCKMKGYTEYTNKTEYLFNCIQNTLKELKYYESPSKEQTNSQVKQNFAYLKPHYPIITGIITTTQSSINNITTHWSWTIANSQKLYNNSTLICYIMRYILTK